MWSLEIELVLPSHLIVEETMAQRGWVANAGSHSQDSGEVGVEGWSISGLQPLLVPSSQEVCLECWRDLSQRECPLPRPSGEEGPDLGGECDFRVSFQLHQSYLWCPHPAVLPSMPNAFCHPFLSNSVADPDQSARGWGEVFWCSG